VIPVLLALSAQADPVAQRAPVDGEVAVSVGAPHQSVAWRLPTDDPDDPRVVVSVSTRLPSAATDLSVGLQTGGGPAARRQRGWGWASGVSLGLLVLRGPDVGLSLSPWARVERRGRIHGGAQIAAPLAAARTGGLRLPVVGELFIGSRRDRVHVLAVGGAGWAFVPATPAGSLVVQGSVQVGLELGPRDSDAISRDTPSDPR